MFDEEKDCGIMKKNQKGANIMQLFFFLAEINENSKLAGAIAIGILAGVLLICALCLIIKKLILNKIFHMDEKFVKEYRAKLEERERQEAQKEQKRETIGEDF